LGSFRYLNFLSFQGFSIYFIMPFDCYCSFPHQAQEEMHSHRTQGTVFFTLGVQKITVDRCIYNAVNMTQVIYIQPE
jgi:hypothetical protein